MLAVARCLIVVLNLGVSADGQPDATKINQPLRDELRRMFKDDQEARMKAIELGKQERPDPDERKKLEAAYQDLDRKHTTRMKEIVDKHGWPGKSLVGAGGAHDAWLLVQHADKDRAFQKRCLELMEPLVAKDEVSKQDFAYLMDRVLVAEGKKQRYGTQFKEENGAMVPQPIEDEANIDKRRAAIGLSTMAEYKKLIDEMYKPKSKSTKDG